MLRLSFTDFIVVLILVPALLFLGWVLQNLTRERQQRPRRH